jgi:hypothetical protein
MGRIVRLQRTARQGLVCEEIFGPNLLEANHVPVSLAGDPRVQFIQAAMLSSSSSAHAGALAFEGDEPEEIF